MANGLNNLFELWGIRVGYDDHLVDAHYCIDFLAHLSLFLLQLKMIGIILYHPSRVGF